MRAAHGGPPYGGAAPTLAARRPGTAAGAKSGMRPGRRLATGGTPRVAGVAPLCELAGLPRPVVGRVGPLRVGGPVGVRPAPWRVCAASSRAARGTGSRQPPPAHGAGGAARWLAAGRPAGVGSPGLPACVPCAFSPVTAGGAPSRARRGVGRVARPGRRAVARPGVRSGGGSAPSPSMAWGGAA